MHTFTVRPGVCSARVEGIGFQSRPCFAWSCVGQVATFSGPKRNHNALDTARTVRPFRSTGAGRKGYKKRNPALGGGRT